MTERMAIGSVSRRDLVGLKGRSKIIWSFCPVCGRERWVPHKKPGILCRSCAAKRNHKKNNPQDAPHRDNCTCMKCRMGKGELHGEHNPAWKGGRRTNIGKGYIAVLVSDDHPMREMAWADDNCILEHRLVMAEYLGRPLRNNEIVHHINGEKGDNRIENLELWIRPHPQGVRLLDYADEIIKHKELNKRRGQ